MLTDHQPLDLDRIALLATTRPAVIDRYLRFKVRQIISQAKPESRIILERLQFRMDAIRRRAGSPLHACIQISKFMHEQLWELNDVLRNGVALTHPKGVASVDEDKPAPPASELPTLKAKVLPFKRKLDKHLPAKNKPGKH
ncbi:DUF3135 domain-containing protein [Aliamphritea hakodatensis]|uniref:DUF3135 domain-containing protein n=1 Tax=Aliamphritea hakodatensis TaxID=2895352 RepID=UPI0022FDA766|nr:DUF3135 domain-containing protein [Aliamphritea hakodatensis]